MDVIHGKKWDWNITSGELKVIAWLVGFIGFLAWAGFSTPNTIGVTAGWSKDVQILHILYSGLIMGIIAGLVISILEVLFIYLAVEKWSFFWLLVFACGFVSIMGTLKWADIGNQNANIKNNEVQTARELVDNQKVSIQKENEIIDNYQKKINKYDSMGLPAPNWVYQRQRQAIERLTEKQGELDRLSQNYIITEKTNGPIIKIGDGKKAGLALAVLMEILIIGCTVIFIGIRNAAKEKEKEENAAEKVQYIYLDPQGNPLPADLSPARAEHDKQKVGFPIGEREKENKNLGNLRPNFGDIQGDLTKANTKRLELANERKKKIKEIYGYGVRRPIDIHNIMRDQGYDLSPTRIGQILREEGLA